MTYKALGIILKRTNLGEADRIVTVLTRDHGKIRVVAKGVRKTLSKMAGHLEPFCLTRLEIAEGRNLDIICGAEVQNTYMALRSDLTKANTYFYLAEIIDKMVEERAPHKEIFELLKMTLDHADEIADPLLVPFFEINFLAEMGFRPELGHCLKCNIDITPQNNRFDLGHGGLICGNCNDGRPISDEAIKLLRLLLDHSFKSIQKIKVNNKIICEIQELTSNYLKHIHQDDFKSEKYLRT